MSETRVTEAQRLILQFLADQPDGSCRVNWLPTDIDFKVYRALRDDEHRIEESEGKGGFTLVWITPAGRALLDREGA